MIKRAFDALEKGAFLNEFVPCPKELCDDDLTTWSKGPEQADRDRKKADLKAKYGYESWYDWNIANWGTKWDVGDEGSQTLVNENELTTTFSSAWSPPTGAYAKLQDLGFEVEAYYYEPGMCFAGIYDENGDDCYNIEGSSESVRENIPQRLDEMFNISENMADYEDENQEIELNDGIDSINE